MNAEPLRPDEQVLHQGDAWGGMRPNRPQSLLRRVLSRRAAGGHLYLTSTRLVWVREFLFWGQVWRVRTPGLMPRVVSIELSEIKRFETRSTRNTELVIETAEWIYWMRFGAWLPLPLRRSFYRVGACDQRCARGGRSRRFRMRGAPR